MSKIIFLDPINRDAHFLKLIAESAYSIGERIEVISTQRIGMELNSNILFHSFFREINTINIGKISLTKKVNLLSKYNTGFKKLVDIIQPGDSVLYSSGMSLPEIERIGILRIKPIASKIVMLVHNLEDTQSKLSWISQWRNRRLLETFDGWIFLSNYMRQKALSLLNIPPEKTYVMPHPHFEPILKNIQPDKNLISELERVAKDRHILAYVSRADEEHGIDIFYRVLHQSLCQNLPVYGVVLGRLGKGWSIEKNRLAIRNYGLGSEQLHVSLGTYTYPELLAVLSKADFILAPYRHISQSGAIALALGEKVPVIASCAGANSEMVRNSINGFIFNVNYLDGLINDIVLTYRNNNTMRQRFPITPSFSSHLDPNIAVTNMLNWLKG